MKKNTITLIVLFCVGLCMSCTKKNGENQGLDDKNKKTYDFMPTNSGTWWLYQAADGAVFYRYATGRDSVVEGLTYSYYYRLDTTSDTKAVTPEYFGKNLDKYISLIDVDGTQTSYITYVILKDNWFVGQTWDNTERKKIQGWNLDMWIQSSVQSVTDTLTYNGKTYDSVIYVHNDLSVRLASIPPYVKCGTLDVWFKRGVGIIREKGDINILGGLVTKQYEDWILDYYIKP
jgi:hypothetical protein